MRLRTGNHVGRTIYAVLPDEDEDMLIGVLDTRELATEVVNRWNLLQELYETGQLDEEDQAQRPAASG